MTFKDDAHLNMLQITNNKLKEIPDQLLKGLYAFEILIMTSNQIEAIKADTFSDQKKINLRLEDNNLSVLDIGALNVVPQFFPESRVDLYLKGNKLQKIMWTPSNSGTILRSVYAIHLEKVQVPEEVDLKDFFNQLKTNNGAVQITVTDNKLKDILKEQGLNCFLQSNDAYTFECRNR